MASRPRRQFDPVRIAEALHRHGVEYVIVGGVAARLHGSPHQTRDFDLASSQTAENLDRLARALNDLNPMKLTPRFRNPTPHEVGADELAIEPIASYLTAAGRVDVLHHIGPHHGYDELLATSVRFDLGDGLVVRAAALDEIIAAKELTGRKKDQAQLPSLYATRDELQKRAHDQPTIEPSAPEPGPE